MTAKKNRQAWTGRRPRIHRLRKLTITSHAEGDIVTVRVGKDRQPFYLHKELLMKKCDFFRGMFGGSYKEADEKEADLPEDCPEAFRYFVRWIYGSPMTSDLKPGDDPEVLVKAWIFADKMMCSELQNQIIDFLHDFYTQPADNRFYPVRALVLSGKDDSKLMQMLLQIYAHRLALGWYENTKHVQSFFESYDGKLSHRLMSYILESSKTKRLNPYKDNPCKWHQHDSDSEGSCAKKTTKRRKQ
jgi:hypothetical protein